MSHAEPCRLLPLQTAPGAWNMAVDEWLLRSAELRGHCALRLYEWSPATLSLGYFQPVAARQDHSASRACALVRRSTGGGAILHDRELTYSLVIPTRHRLAVDPLSLYRLAHGALIAALAELGIQTRLCEVAAQLPRDQEPFLCFQRRAVGDVLLGDFKIAGSAQRRHRGAILQHGSVLLAASPFAPELPGISDLMGDQLSAVSLASAFLPRLATALAVTPDSEAPSTSQQESIAQLEIGQFNSAGWLTRR